jgi:phosphotransferase system enzyme I (PtsP)
MELFMGAKNNDFQAFVTNLASELQVDVCSLYQINDDATALILVASYGLSHRVLGCAIPVSKGHVGRVARTKRVIAMKNPDEHPDYYHIADSGEEHYRTFLGIPVMAGRELKGVLVVQTKHAHMYLLEEIAKIHETGRRIEAALPAA